MSASELKRRGEAARLAVHIPEMDCASCATRIRGRLGTLPGVESVDARVIARELRIEYDPRSTSRERIVSALLGLGYDVETGDGRRVAAEPDVSPWRGPEARLVYVSGALLALGLGTRAPQWLVAEPLPWVVALGTVLLVASAAVGVARFFRKGLRALRRLELDMHFLMTAAILGALVIGEYVEDASIAFLFGLAELLEDHAVVRARRSLQALVDLAPPTARVVRAGTELDVPAGDVAVGEVVRVRPGERVPVDGVVSEGRSWVDQSPITGEPMPVEKSPGAEVYAGSGNQGGYLEVRTSKAAADTTLAHILHLVEEAESSRAPTQRFVERFARIYTPAVTILAVLVMVVPPLFLGGAFTTWFIRGLTLLVISCPCALVISTPVTVVSGITSAARNGVLIKGGTYLEALGEIEVVAFDKTGTLTAGRADVTDVVASPSFSGAGSDSPERRLIGLAAALEARSEHPIADAIRRKARTLGVSSFEGSVSEFEALPGLGARARLNGRLVQIGRAELFAELGGFADVIERLSADGKTAVCVGTEREVFGVIAVRDLERRAARRAIAELRRQGVRRIVMLTGDRRAAAEAVGRELGVDEVYAELLPAEKAEIVRRLQREAGAVAMVGDGVNDAPALAAATVGIAMGAAGSDAALETAHVALMGDDIEKLPYLFHLSRVARQVLRQNVFASILLKASLAVGVFPGWVSLITAVLVGDMGASLGVTANALRLARVNGAGRRWGRTLRGSETPAPLPEHAGRA